MYYGKSVQESSPVLSLTIIDKSTLNDNIIDENTSILLTVRDKNTNLTHPNVISVPTQRIPASLLSELKNSSTLVEHDNSSSYYSEHKVSSLNCNGHHPVIYAVESILSRKLGLSDALESQLLSFDAYLYIVLKGKSYHPNLPKDDGREEFIEMANIVVITSDIEIFPKHTPSYSHILWESSKNFINTVKDKNPMLVKLDPIEYCIHGLCIETSYRIIIKELVNNQVAKNL